MKEKYTLLVMIMSSIIVISGCAQRIQLPQCDSFSDLKDKTECYARIGLSNSLNPNVCENITDKNYQNVCVAMMKHDESICAGLDNAIKTSYDTGLKDFCYDGVVGFGKMDVSICNKITKSGLKDSCSAGVGINKQDISICDKIAGTEYRDACFSGLKVEKQDISLCDKIADMNIRDLCYRNMAVTRKDNSICEKIGTAVSKANCYTEFCKDGDTQSCELRDRPINQAPSNVTASSFTAEASGCESIADSNEKNSCYIELAQNENNSVLCEKPDNVSDRNLCYQRIVEKTGNATICENIETVDYGGIFLGKDVCYGYAAMKDKDLAICDKIEYADYRTLCIAEIKIDVTMCNDIKDDFEKDRCYKYMATVTKDQTLCAKARHIPDVSYMRDFCYGDIAMNRKDISICSKVELQDYKTLCTATIKNDISLCENIQNETFRDACRGGYRPNQPTSSFDIN